MAKSDSDAKAEERRELTWCADPEGVGCCEVVLFALVGLGGIVALLAKAVLA